MSELRLKIFSLHTQGKKGKLSETIAVVYANSLLIAKAEFEAKGYSGEYVITSSGDNAKYNVVLKAKDGKRNA